MLVMKATIYFQKLVLGIMVVLFLAGCNGKDKPDVPPQPVSVELGIGTITRGAIIQDNKMTTEWGINDVVHLWAKGEELDKPFLMLIDLIAFYRGSNISI